MEGLTSRPKSLDLIGLLSQREQDKMSQCPDLVATAQD